MVETESERLASKAPSWGSPNIQRAQEVDRKLREHARRRARDDYELGTLLREGYLLRVHELGGFASFREYAEQLFGFTARQTEERLRVAEVLESLPELAAKLAAGELCWSVVRELTRVCTQDNEQDWIAAAEDRKANEVGRMVSGRVRGELPNGPSRPEAQRHRVTLDLDAPSYALWLELRRDMVRDTGHSLDDASLVTLLARGHLGGRDEGRSSYQIGMTICERCRHAAQRSGAESVTVDPQTVEAAYCDAQLLGRVDEPTPKRATQTIPPATRRAVIARQEHRCAVPGCRHASFLDVHHTTPRSEGGDHDPELLVALCSAHHAMAHRGTLIVRGSFREGFAFEHSDGRRYGSAGFDGQEAQTFTQAFDSLRSMGFKEREARAMLDAVRPHVGAAVALSELLTEALRRWPLPTRMTKVSGVREAGATYVRIVERDRPSRSTLYARISLPAREGAQDEIHTESKSAAS